MTSVVRALYDYDAPDSNGLSFRKDDLITVLNKLDSGWWDGLCNGARGW
jgi:son of sevenless-like protein